MPSVEFTDHKRRKSDLSFLQLQAELIRIDLLIHHAVRRWQTANQNQAALDEFHGQYISDTEINALLGQPLGASWWQPSSNSEPEQMVEVDVLAKITQRVESLRQTAWEQDKILRLDHLVTTFGLSDFERDVLLVCLAPAFDRRYERFYGYLQDDATRRWPSVNLILDLLCEPNPERLLQLEYFADDAALFRYQLLTAVREPGVMEPPLLNQAVRPDKTVVSWLLGRYQPHAKLGVQVSLEWPRQGLQTEILLVGVTLRGLQHVIAEELPIFVFYGRDEGSQRAAGRLLANYVGRPLLRVDLAALIQEGLAPFDALRLALRDARLSGAIPYLSGWDACLKNGVPGPTVFAELCNHPDLAIAVSRERWQPQGIDRDHYLIWLEFSLPEYPQRQAMWWHFLGQAAEIEALDIPALSSQFSFTSDQIRDTVASARDLAVQRGSSLQNEALFAAARAQADPRLSTLARQIKPRYQWADIILPEDQLAMLHELVATVRGRPKVLYDWDVRRKLVSNAGITALFAGPPGTGKTMAAEVIASELNLDLYKIDLSTIVNKYIGETEKNLEKVFTEAETSNAILFFDEADALFGKRSEVRDAHDRYANIEISYLLQRMEAYDGITILATNLRANLDEAFTRRLQFAVDFPFPEEDERLHIWETLFPATVPRHPELDLALMARRFKLAGGNIRNIIVSAAYLAAADGGQVSMEHLMHGTRRELQKMGRMMNERDLIVDS